jgi:serine/threonine protein kinase
MSLQDAEIQAQKIAREFQRHWPAEIDDYLPIGSARVRTVINLSHIDLERRWGEGREGRAADYFRRYPEEWAATEDKGLSLIEAEYELRREHLDFQVYCQDYADRQDGLVEHLRWRFTPPPSAPRYRDFQYYEGGGLGEVFIANDTQLGRAVAVKRMNDLCRQDRRSREQFRFEAEVTGRLEHPGILPVYSLECGEGGEPEYSMRFIGPDRGETMRAAIQKLHDPTEPNQAWTLRELLGRFVFIGRTIAYAHDRGYLHRDIKPDNILFGHFGETWVIDWGLAKFYKTTSDESPVEGSTPERASLAQHDPSSSVSIADGSKPYSSPEQVDRKPMGRPSDVYSLGATLHCLLTGRDPGQLEDKPDGPSETGNPSRCQAIAMIPRALDAIARKAMAREPEDRYPSADALADDVQAFLNDERVDAWPDPIPARVSRAIRKRPTAAVSTFAAMILSVVLLGVWNYFEHRRSAAELANNVAVVNLQKSLIAAMADFSRDDVFEKKYHEINPQNVTNALRTIEALHQAAERASPEDRENWAITALKIATETRKRGSFEDSKRAYRLACNIYVDLIRDFPENNQASKNLAATRLNLANLELSTGESESALKNQLEGASILELIVNQTQADREARFSLVKIRLSMANFAKDRNDLVTADREVQAGLKLIDDLVREDPDNRNYLFHQAKGWNTLGNVLGTGRKLPESLEALEKGLKIRERLAKEDPVNFEYQADLALSLYNIGFLKGQLLDTDLGAPKAKRLERVKEAIDTLVKCWEIREKLHRDRTGDAHLFAQLCQVQGEIGSLFLRSGRTDNKTLAEASKFLESAVSGYEQLKSQQETSTEFSEPFAACCQNLGIIQLLRKNLEGGLTSFARAEDEYKKLLAGDSRNLRYRQLLGQQAFSVGNILVALNESKDKARQSLEKARVIQQALVDEAPNHPGYRQQWKMTVDLLQKLE